MRMLKYLVPGVILAFLLNSCTKVDKVGPDLNGIYSKVEIAESLTVSKSNPNFATGDKVAFKAKFIKDTYWVLTITGSTSGATKTFTGTSNEISPNRIVWNGSSDGPGSFVVETAVAKVKFPYSPTDSMSVNITIVGARNPNTGGVMISDFTTFPFTDIDWPTVSLTNNDTIYPKISGSKYLLFKGMAKAGKGNFAGYLGIRASQVGYAATGKFPLYANGNLIYFNMMAYGTGDKVRMRIMLLEDKVDARYIDIIPDWIGWKLISVKYTDFLPAVVGNTAMNPQDITDIGMIYFTNETDLTKVVSFPCDKLIFTHNVPYQP